MQFKNGTATFESPPRLVFVGLWAQNAARKPEDWYWSGSNKRTSEFIIAMRQITHELSVRFIDTFDMTLSMLDANKDGVHFNESVTRSIAMLMAKNIEMIDL